MKQILSILFLLSPYLIYCQSRIFTISNAPDFNVTAVSPYQPMLPSLDANLNINTLINSLNLQDVIVNEAAFFSFELAIIDDVIYASPFRLTLTSNNNLLGYADLKNDSTGNIDLFGLTNVVIGTEPSWLPFYGLNPLPVFQPPLFRSVEMGSLKGTTLVDAGTYIALVSPNQPASPTQLGRVSGSLTANLSLLAGNYILVQAGGPDSYAMVGFGQVTSNEDHDVDIRLNVEEGNIWITGGEANAYAQIGNRQTGPFMLDGSIEVFARSVGVNVPLNGNVTLDGGVGLGSEARIGHVQQSNQLFTEVHGRISVIDSSSVILRSGSGAQSQAVIGHFSSSNDFILARGPIFVEARHTGIVLDASSRSQLQPAHCQIGHATSSTNGNCDDSIYLITGGSVSCYSGDDSLQFVNIGHIGEVGNNDNLAGIIEINAGDSIALISNLGKINFAHIGHFINPLGGGGMTSGNILIRSGGRQYYSSIVADHTESFVKVGHHAPTIFGSLTLLAFANIDIESSADISGLGEALIIAYDTLQLTSGDSINIQSNEAKASLEASAASSVMRLDAASDISLVSNLGNESALHAFDALDIRLRAANDIWLSQSSLATNHLTGKIWIESDHNYLPDSLFAAQSVKPGVTNPFSIVTLGSGNQVLFSDGLGVIRFRNQNSPTMIKTVNGDIHIRSKSISVDGSTPDLTISGNLTSSIHPMTQTGSIFIGMDKDNLGQLIDLGDSYQNGIIQNWTISNSGKLFFNANNHIGVLNSEIQMQEVLLETN